MRHIHTPYIFIIFIILLLLSSIPFLHAATEQRIALVIGNSAYSTGPLKNPANDAPGMAAMLKKLGFTVTLKKNARLQEMDEAIEELGNKLKRGGVGLFFYAGHGVQVNGANYLLPIGARINKEADIKYQAVDANKILDEMATANNGLNIVILDACRDNPFARSFRNASRGLAIVSSAPSGTFISYSTSPGNVARDGDGRNSPYTAALMKFMQEPGLTISDVFINVRTKLKKETGQVPWELSSLEGKFYFVPDSVAREVLGKQQQKEYVERPSVQVRSPESSSFDELKRNMDERREKESQWVKDFEDAKKMEQESSSMAEKIQVWRQFIATLPDEHTAKGDEIRKYASNRVEKLERWKAIGKTPTNEIKKDGRFVAYDDGTVLDTKTHLMWAARDNGSNINWQNAKSYCENYRGGGYTDWRVPTQDDLAGLYDAGKSRTMTCDTSYQMHVATELIDITCFALWDSETSGSKAAYFLFDGRGSRYWGWQSSGNNCRALPVRSGE
ncbi:MAG: caspase family protein [Syntrophales bacterium LBB04]|nr:caspase family protein [Syntrophales bacterium LBB04]